jgi:hypothetical protein
MSDEAKRPAIKKRFDKFIETVCNDLHRVHGKDCNVIIIRDKNCPYHIECPLDYQTIKIRCVLDKIAKEDILLCENYSLGRHQNFVRKIAVKTYAARGYEIFDIETLSRG